MLYLIRLLIELTALKKVEWEKDGEYNFRLKQGHFSFRISYSAEIRFRVKYSDDDVGAFETDVRVPAVMTATMHEYTDPILYSKLHELYDLVFQKPLCTTILELSKLK